jgi:hypothetical protein
MNRKFRSVTAIIGATESKQSFWPVICTKYGGERLPHSVGGTQAKRLLKPFGFYLPRSLAAASMSDSEYGEDSFCDFEAEASSVAAELRESDEQSSQTSPEQLGSVVIADGDAVTAAAMLPDCLNSVASELVQAILAHCLAALAQSPMIEGTATASCIKDQVLNDTEPCAMSKADSFQIADNDDKLQIHRDPLQNHAVGCNHSSIGSSSSDTATGTPNSDRSYAISTSEKGDPIQSCADSTILECSNKQSSTVTAAATHNAQPLWTPCYRPGSAAPVNGITVKLTQCSAVKRKLASAARRRQQHTASVLNQSNAAARKQITSSSIHSAAPQSANPYVRTRPHWSNMTMSYDEAAWVARRKAELLPQFTDPVNWRNSSSSSSCDSSGQRAKRRPATARPTARYTLQPLQPKLEPMAKSRIHVAVTAARSSARPATAPASRIGRLSAHSLLYGAPP